VLVDMNQTTLSTNENTRYHCKWTPFHNHQFSSRILSTWVNGNQVFDGVNVLTDVRHAQRLTFEH